MPTLYLEHAKSSRQREVGLQNRKCIGKNGGMLFEFPSKYRLGFWMSNTYIPLDIAFIDDDGKILQIEKMTPLSTRSIIANSPCRYAIESNSGWFGNNKVNVGSYVSMDMVGKKNRLAQVDIGAQPDQVDQNIAKSPDVRINKSIREILEEYDIKVKSLIIIYQTKDGITLPPKKISPPFNFEKDADGMMNKIVKCWDDQMAGWKSFIIDNIIDVQDADEIK